MQHPAKPGTPSRHPIASAQNHTFGEWLPSHLADVPLSTFVADCPRRNKMASALVNVSNELAGIVEKLAPHVVSVHARRHYPSSGLLWAPDVVVTSNHTIQREEDISITLADGKTTTAALVGRDPGSDLALLKLAAPAGSGTSLARAESPKAGELALVLGRSPNSGVNASLGIISAVSGEWRTWRGGQLEAYIRLDAKLFPHSSGGAVVNARGELIGIATDSLSRIAGVAVPVSTVARVTEKLLEKGFVPRGYLGVGIQPVALPEQLAKNLSLSNQSGLMVLMVEPEGPADKAGVLIGDILVGVGDKTIEHPEDLQKYSDSGVIGKQTTAKFIRGGVIKDLSITVGERPRRSA
jgi:S1-C subfamily serine protease